MNVPLEYHQALNNFTGQNRKYILCTNETLTFREMLSPHNTSGSYETTIVKDAKDLAITWIADYDVDRIFETYGQRTELYQELQKVFLQARSRGRKSRETRILALQMFFMMIQRRFFDRSELVLTEDQRARITGSKLISNIANDPSKKRKSTTQV